MQMQASLVRASLLAILGFTATSNAALAPTIPTNTNETINSQVRLAYAGPNGAYLFSQSLWSSRRFCSNARFYIRSGFLTLTLCPLGMVVSWNTFDKVARPTVKYGTSPQRLIYCAESTVSVTYDTSLTYNNHVPLKGLKPDTLYYYLPEPLLKDDSTTAPYSFRTSRLPGDTTPYSVAVTIDMGTMGPDGLSTTAGQGVNPNNVLGPNDNNTVQSLTAVVDSYDFLWQRNYPSKSIKDPTIN